MLSQVHTEQHLPGRQCRTAQTQIHKYIFCNFILSPNKISDWASERSTSKKSRHIIVWVNVAQCGPSITPAYIHSFPSNEQHKTKLFSDQVLAFTFELKI